MYKEYLYPFRFQKEDSKIYDTKNIKSPLRVTSEEYLSKKEFAFEEFFLNNEPALFEKFCEVLNIEEKIFDIKTLQNLYGKIQVDVINQHSWRCIGENGFTLSSKEYPKYILFFIFLRMVQEMEFEVEFSKFCAGSADLEESKSKLANNIDLQEWRTVYDELKNKIPEKISFSSKYDWISLLRQEVRGITQPQFNIQLDGSWIGGHQEPFGFKIIFR